MGIPAVLDQINRHPYKVSHSKRAKKQKEQKIKLIYGIQARVGLTYF